MFKCRVYLFVHWIRKWWWWIRMSILFLSISFLDLCTCFGGSLSCCISYLQIWMLSAIAGIRFILSSNYRLAMLLANDRTESHTHTLNSCDARNCEKWDKITHRILYALVIGTSLLIAWPFKNAIVFVRLILIAWNRCSQCTVSHGSRQMQSHQIK